MDRFLDPHDTLADKGYQGLDLITPVKKLPGAELTDDEKHLNQHINHHRVVIERVIAHFKRWRVLSSIFRRPPHLVPESVLGGAGTVFLDTKPPK